MQSHGKAKNIDNKMLILNEGYANSRVIIERAYSCFLEDASHNELIDTSLGCGTHILGTPLK